VIDTLKNIFMQIRKTDPISVFRKLISFLPLSFKKQLFSGSNFYCPICESNTRLFLPFGVIVRSNAWCPVCGSLERHRLIWLLFQQQTGIFDTQRKRMLHIAPEAAISSRLESITTLDYLTADLSPSRAMVQMDITDIHYPDNLFDIIYCSHVLEHIPDDRKAIRELCRVLSSEGLAIILVPVAGEITIEDLSITDPEERKKLYGEPDHVRSYGSDIKDRLEETGFKVTIVFPTELAEKTELLRMNIPETEIIFLCSKNGKSK